MSRPTNQGKVPTDDYQRNPAEALFLFDFSESTPDRAWRVEDDRVMGGVSQGEFEINEEGYGHFWGEVSLENNGGFSSVQHYLDETYQPAKDKSKFVVRIKGDGKDFNFRIQPKTGRHAYIYSFPTTGEWETVEVPFAEMVPRYRGEKVPVGNYAGEPIGMIRFLIGSKKNETFDFLIDRVEVM